MLYNRFIGTPDYIGKRKPREIFCRSEAGFLHSGGGAGMLISTKGRYALRVMVDLAEHRGEGSIPLKVIARRQGVSEKYLESIIKLLVKSRLLSGVRGKGGGYRLTREPGQYTVGAVLRLTEESLAPVACLGEGADGCPRAGACRTLPLWQGLDRLINEYLDGVTLADLAREGDGPAI